MKTILKKGVMLIFAVAVLVTLPLCLAVCGCASTSGGDIDVVQVPTDTPAPTASPEPTPSPKPTPTPSPGPEEYCFSRCMVRFRIVKNRFYNAIDSAFSEDASMAGYLYQILDFVYGDYALDMFAECGRNETAFIAELERNGYTSCEVVEEANTVIINALMGETACALTAMYDRPSDSGSITIAHGSVTQLIFEWVATSEGYAVQYIKSDASSDADLPVYTGYRGYFYDNGDGQLTFGTYSTGEPALIFANASIDEGFVHRNMYTYDIYKLMDGVLTVRYQGRILTYVVGSATQDDEALD